MIIRGPSAGRAVEREIDLLTHDRRNWARRAIGQIRSNGEWLAASSGLGSSIQREKCRVLAGDKRDDRLIRGQDGAVEIRKRRQCIDAVVDGGVCKSRCIVN